MSNTYPYVLNLTVANELNTANLISITNSMLNIMLQHIKKALDPAHPIIVQLLLNYTVKLIMNYYLFYIFVVNN